MVGFLLESEGLSFDRLVEEMEDVDFALRRRQAARRQEILQNLTEMSEKGSRRIGNLRSSILTQEGAELAQENM